jgi:deazaflavin-dependent oxidoreductase (nitroreductase family)
LAKTGRGPFSILQHTGRKTGRLYQTPVITTTIGETIIIALTYGEKVDWLRNILAQGGCNIFFGNKWWHASHPAVIGADSAYSMLPESRSTLFRRFRFKKFLLMQLV